MPRRFQSLVPLERPKPALLPEDKLSLAGAVRNSVMLDTAFGQGVMTAGFAQGYGVPLLKLNRDIVEGYNPFTDPQIAGVQERFLPEFVGSTSPQETSLRLSMLDENLDLRTSLEDYGFTRFAAGLLDPINLVPVPFLLGKGALNGLKSAMAASLPVIGATEAVRHHLDPSSTKLETFFNVGAGMLFMGAIGGLAGRYYRNPESLTVGQAVRAGARAAERGLDIIIPLDRPVTQTSAFGGMPPHMGTVAGAFRRHMQYIQSLAAQGDLRGPRRRINLKNRRPSQAGDAAGGPLDRIGGVVREGPEGYPRGYLPDDTNTGGVLNARKIHDIQKQDYQATLDRLENEQLIEELAEQLNTTTGEVFTAMNKTADRLDAEIKQADEFFAREDVQKQEAVEMELRNDPDQVGKRSLDDIELVKDRDLDIIEGVPRHIRAELREFTEIQSRLRDKIADLDEQIVALKRGIGAAGSKSWRTRRKKELSKVEQDRQYLVDNLNRVDNRVNQTRRHISDLNAKQYIEDWDLMPAAMNEVLGKLDQFPFWHLIKNDFRNVDEAIGLELQKFSYQMAGTPGLSSRGNALGRTLGPSVENMAQTWQGPFIAAMRAKQKLYTKYIGLGEDSTQFNAYWIDTKQRVRSTYKKVKTGTRPEKTNDGKLTMEAFNHEVSRTLISGDSHPIKEINQAAAEYKKVFQAMGEEGRRLGIFWTQRNAERQIVKIDKELDRIAAKVKQRPGMKEAVQKQVDELELQKMRLEQEMKAYEEAGSQTLDGPDYFHRMWRADRVRENRDALIGLLEDWFRENPKVRRDAEVIELSTDPADIRARAEEAYASILREADTGDAEFNLNSIDKREWLLARQKVLQKQFDSAELGEDGTIDFETAVVERRLKIIERKLDQIENGRLTVGGAGPLLQRSLDIPNKVLLEHGFIETDIDAVVGHYVARMGPAIEITRKFGDVNARFKINDLHQRMVEKASKASTEAEQKRLTKKADQYREDMIVLTETTQGIYQIPDDPAAITGRTLRLLRNFNVLTAMGRATLMALADTGNVIISQGFTNTFGSLIDRWGSGVHNGNIRMMDKEVELAGSVVEVALGMRYHQFTEIGAQWFAANRVERNVATATQRFFLLNLMGPWTDMMKKVAGGMVQSKIIENSLAWRAGEISAEDAKIMARLGIDKERALQIATEWEKAGSLKHKEMFIANTEQWADDLLRREFRAAMNNEVARAVITPGVPDKPKALLKSEWWKVFGQYKGFGISATHRILGAGLQQKGAQKYAGFASMIGIAMMVDMFKRPDYMQVSPQEQVLRAVELSGVTGILLDINDTIERASAGAIGIRPAFGMEIRERSPNWANRMGAVAGAVPNQWLQVMWALTSDDAELDDQARIMRYTMPYNNVFYWKTVFDRGQRGIVDTLED